MLVLSPKGFCFLPYLVLALTLPTPLGIGSVKNSNNLKNVALREFKALYGQNKMAQSRFELPTPGL